MAGYHVTNSTDKPVRVKIHVNREGGPMVVAGDVYPGRTQRFTDVSWISGARYRLVADYPGWQANIFHVLGDAEFDTLEVIGGAGGGRWNTP